MRGNISKPPLNLRCLAAEAFGTFALVFAGKGAIVVNDISGGAITHVGIALTFGLIVLTMIIPLAGVLQLTRSFVSSENLMEIVRCKNCEMNVALLADRVCPSCGLNTDIRTTLQPSSDERRLSHRNVLRNAVWLMTIYASLPAAIALYNLYHWLIGNGSEQMKMDAITIALLTYVFAISILCFACSIMISMGLRAGRAFAYIPAYLMLLNFPIGTIIAVYVLRKLNNPVYLSTLE